MTANEIQYQIISQRNILAQEQLIALYQSLPQYPDADFCSLLQSYGYLSPADVAAIRQQVQSYPSSSSARVQSSSSGQLGVVNSSQSATEQSIVQQLHEVLKVNPWFQPSAELLWEKLQKLGEGGMGTVYKVRDPRLERNAALKLLLEEDNELAVKRFLREVKITARLEHPNIPPVYEVGKTTSGQLYMVMKVVEGVTLKDRIKRLHRKKTVDRHALEEVLAAFVKVGEAVGYAHSLGIIHRDLKPENIMLGRFGEVQVMDWGIAKDLESLEESEEGVVESCDISSHELDSLGVTVTGSMVGTPGYMAPEQVEGGATREGDVYALGVILTEILTGEKANPGKAMVERIAATVTGSTKTPRDIDRRIAKDIDGLVKAACELDPKKRLASAELFVENLRAYLAQSPLPVYRYSLVERGLGAISRRPGFFVGTAMLFVLLSSTTALYQAFRTSEQQREEAVNIAESATKSEEDLKKAVTALYSLDQAVQRGMPEKEIKERLDAALELGQFDYSLLLSAAKVCVKAGLRDRAKELLFKASRDKSQEKPYEALFMLHRIELAENLSNSIRMTDSAKELVVRARAAGDENEFTVTMDAAKLYLAGQIQESYRIISRLEKYSQSFAFGYFIRGLIEAKLAKDDDAEKSLKKSMAIDPDFVSAINAMGVLARKRGRFEEAIKLYSKSIQLAPKDFRAYSGRSLVWKEKFDLERALEDSNVAVRLNNKDAQSLQNRAAIKSALEDLEGSQKDLLLAATIDPGNPQIQYNLGILRHQMGKQNEAKKILEDVVLKEPIDVVTLRLRAQLKAGLEDYKGAIADFDACLEKDQGNPELFRLRGMTKGFSGDLEGSIADLDKSLTLNPRDPTALNSRGVAKLRLKRNVEALSDFDAALKLRPKYLNALINRGTVLKNLKRYREAAKALDRVLARKPDLISALRLRATCRRNTKDYRGALRDFDRLEKLAPNDKDLYNNRGVLKAFLKDYEGAYTELTKALKQDPKNAQTYVNRSTILKNLGRRAEAIKDLSQAITLNPKLSHAYRFRGDHYEKLKQYENALKDYETLIKLRPQSANAHLSKGRVLNLMNRKKDAAAALKIFLKLQPKAPNAEKLREFVKRYSQ